MTTTWILVVIVSLGSELQVWPGATEWLLNRRSQAFETQCTCDIARAQLLARGIEPELPSRWSATGAQQLTEVYRPVVAVCILVPLNDAK